MFFKRYLVLCLIGIMMIFTSGCTLLKTALAAGAAYGIAKALDK